MTETLKLEAYQPTKEQEFWCSNCDVYKVNSSQPQTGKFFVQFGHQFTKKTNQYDGEYVGVMFAVCCCCLNFKEKN